MTDINAVRHAVAELLRDLEAHPQQESGPVEMRNRSGSWEDVADRVDAIRALITPEDEVSQQWISPARPGTTQQLVTVYGDGTAELAHRGGHGGTWGPPVTLEPAP